MKKCGEAKVSQKCVRLCQSVTPMLMPKQDHLLEHKEKHPRVIAESLRGDV